MATMTSTKTICIICNKEMRTYLCDGCSQRFCHKHLDEHRKNLEREFDHIETNHDELRQMINEQKKDPRKHPLMKEIDQWERKSIEQIQKTANQCRDRFISYINSFFVDIENKLVQLARQMRQMRDENDFNDLDLNQLKEKLEKIENELLQPPDLCLEQQSTSFINFIYLRSPSKKHWKEFATTIAGGNGEGGRLDQLAHPYGIWLDEQNQNIYISDCYNHRIVEWKLNATSGRIVAGGNGPGDRLDQLKNPTDVIIDRKNNDLIIADFANRRVMRWPLGAVKRGQIIISDIDCRSLTMDDDGSLYVTDWKKNEVRRWEKGETQGTVVAGGNGEGDQLSQFRSPIFTFVDNNHTLYVSDSNNYRVMKWTEGAKEGIIVAGGNGEGSQTTQLSGPQKVLVDQFGQIYVADSNNHRVMQWSEGAKKGIVVVGGNGEGQKANQLSNPISILFDSAGALYVADRRNHRIQKFEIDRNVNQLMK